MTIEYIPIGFVKSPVKEGKDTDWGKVVSEVIVDSDLADGLTELEEFSHIIVVFAMHESTWDRGSDLVRRPQGREDMPMTGIFAQRAKHRPNPVGITAVRLLEVRVNSLLVQGLDAIDDTPVIDIKPYFKQYDRVDDLVCPEWVDTLMEGYF